MFRIIIKLSHIITVLKLVDGSTQIKLQSIIMILCYKLQHTKDEIY